MEEERRPAGAAGSEGALSDLSSRRPEILGTAPRAVAKLSGHPFDWGQKVCGNDWKVGCDGETWKLIGSGICLWIWMGWVEIRLGV